ncbi:MAG: pyruvate ferredoxin oxidoreductase [Bacteroidaceae bacterium]
MDYKYIEQLLERYWACETTLEEEQILRTFFLQENLPSHLQTYKSIFSLQDEQAQPQLSADFDSCILKRIGEEQKPAEAFHAHRITFRHRLRPLYQAAGLVALLLTIGTAAQHSIAESDNEPQTTFAATEEPDTQENAYKAIPNQQSASLQTIAMPVDTLNQKQ